MNGVLYTEVEMRGKVRMHHTRNKNEQSLYGV